MCGQAYGAQGVECNGLFDNDSPTYVPLNIWLPVSDTVKEVMGGVVLVKEECH